MIKAKEMLRRITGVSLDGLSWQSRPPERDAVKVLLAFLEDRRALFNPHPAEVEDHVRSSVLMIREKCVETLGRLDDDSPASRAVRAIGAACRRFLDEPHAGFEDLDHRRHDPHFGAMRRRGPFRDDSPEAFFAALGEFRAFVGCQIAALCAEFDLDVHGELTSIIPPRWDDFE